MPRSVDSQDRVDLAKLLPVEGPDFVGAHGLLGQVPLDEHRWVGDFFGVFGHDVEPLHGLQAFVGALHGAQADRGIFITTSSFTSDAEDYAERVAARIVLIDGQHLSDLMVSHGVGVQDEETFVLKGIDEDYFEA